MDESVVGKRGGHFELDSKISPEVEEMTTGELEETTEAWSDHKFETESVQSSRHVCFSFPCNPFLLLLPCFPSRRHTGNAGKHSGSKKGTGSSSMLHSDPEHQPSADIVLFTPELAESSAKDRSTDEYRFLCPHAGQFKCKLTDLVFEMEGKGDVSYRVVYWDNHVLEGLHQEEPAGPLYDIDCPEGSIRHLHLPHCETCKDEVKLTVAHVSEDKMEMIRPVTVTNSHVTINIQSLSRFGLTIPSKRSQLRAQVLLFYKKVPQHNVIELHVHLLPANVPLKEVQRQCESYKYIQTTSNCDLTLGKKYRPCCKTAECEYEPRPELVRFNRDCGPNYHPTFVVHLTPEADRFTLILLDKKGKEVWTPPEILLTDTELAAPRRDITGADFVDQRRERLIHRFVAVMEVADSLKSNNMITDEMYSKIQAKPTPQDKMRELYTCLDSAGRAAKQEFYEILERRHSLFVNDE